jgi:Peptidase family M28
MGRAALLVTIVVALALQAVMAQTSSSTAWFGVRQPVGLGDPHHAVVDTSAVTPPPAVVPPCEERHAELTGPLIRRDLERIVDFAKTDRASGAKAWGRITGFPSAAAAMTWAADRFRDAGLQNVQVQQYDGTGEMWHARSWEARLLPDMAFGAGTSAVILESALPTSGSQIRGGTLTAALVHVGDVTAELPSALDVNGKVAVQHLKPASGAYSERTRVSTRARALAAKGAVAVINVIEQTGNMYVRDFGNCGAPCFNVGTADGAFLEEVIARAARASREVRMQLTLQAELLTKLTGQNIVGLVPGENTQENIIVNAHGDGWFDAAGDNGDGFAVVLAMARHFAKPEHKPARTLLFVISGGHHSSGLNGPANLVRMNPELTGRTVLVVNLEHVAQLAIRSGPWRAEAVEQPMSFGISNQSPFLIELGKRAKTRYGVNLNEPFGASVPGDLGGYEPLGVARVQAIHSGPMYHTSGDVLDTISVPGPSSAPRGSSLTSLARRRRHPGATSIRQSRNLEAGAGCQCERAHRAGALSTLDGEPKS